MRREATHSLFAATALPVAIVVLVSAWAPASEAQRIGRLFSTVEERIDLDEIRDDPEFGKVAAPAPAVVKDSPKGPSVTAVTVNGVVLRTRGPNVSWINGTRIDAGDMTPDGVTVDTRDAAGGRVRIRLPDGPETVELKPGQKIDVTRGQVFEAYEFGRSDRSRSAFEAPSSADEAATEATVGPVEPGDATTPATSPEIPANADAGEIRRLLDRMVEQQIRAAADGAAPAPQ